MTFFKLFTESAVQKDAVVALERRLKQAPKAKFPDPLAELEQLRQELQTLVERLTV